VGAGDLPQEYLELILSIIDENGIFSRDDFVLTLGEEAADVLSYDSNGQANLQDIVNYINTIALEALVEEGIISPENLEEFIAISEENGIVSRIDMVDLFGEEFADFLSYDSNGQASVQDIVDALKTFAEE